MRKTFKKRIYALFGVLALLMSVSMINVSAQYDWSGWYSPVTDPTDSENEVTEISLGRTDARKSATLENFPSILGNYTLSYDIYFESDIQTQTFYYFPKIIIDDDNYIIMYIDENGMFLKINDSVSIPVVVSKQQWHNFKFIFYPSSQSVSLMIDDSYVSDSENKQIFSLKCPKITSLYFFREIPGTSITSYIDNIKVEAFSLVSLKSDAYNVDDENLKVRKVPRGTSVSEFTGNIIVTDANYKILSESGDEKTAGLIEDGDSIVLYDDEQTFSYSYLIMLSGYSVNSDFYNVDNTLFEIRGIEQNTKCSDFLSNLKIMGGEAPKIYNKKNEVGSEEIIENGFTFYITDNDKETTYKLKTDKAEDYAYFNDTFDDGDKSGWNSGSVIVDEKNPENKVLAFDLSSAFSAVKSINNSRESDLIVGELDIKYPPLSDFSKNILGPYINTPDDKIIMSLRTTGGNLNALNGNGVSSVFEGVCGKWHHIKMVGNTKTRTFDVYVDSKCTNTDLGFQAVDNLKAGIIKIRTEAGEGGIVQIDNFTVYEPYPILMSKISFMYKDEESFDVNKVKNNTDEIKVYFSTREGIDIDSESLEDAVILQDSKGNEIKTEGEYEASNHIYTLKLKEILNENERYTIKVKNISDDSYHKSYSDEMSFTSQSADVKVTGGEILCDSNGLKVSVNLKNTTSENIATDIIAVLYDNSGRALKTICEKYNIDGYCEEPVEVGYYSDEDYINVYKAKIYLKKRFEAPLCMPFEILK